MDAGMMLATDLGSGRSACIVTEGQRETFVPRQFTIFVVIIADFALTVELPVCGWLLAGWADVMLMVSEGQRSAREAIVMVLRSPIGKEELL